MTVCLHSVRTNYKLLMKRTLFAEQKNAALHLMQLISSAVALTSEASTRGALHCSLRQNHTHLLYKVGELYHQSAKLTFVSETD